MTAPDAPDAPAAPRPGPLDGIRILDLTAVVLGPFATQTLGDFGADVIKLEPIEGDVLRSNGVHRHRNMGSVFLATNRNKRSVAVDLKTEAGQEVLRRLLATTDVLVHNMRLLPAERLGLGYEAVRAVRPDIVCCVATGFGSAGPDRDKPAFDDIIQAACGLAQLGRDTPDYLPTLIADKTAGMALVNAILAALLHRARTGEGQFVEVPMFETMVAWVMTEHLAGLTFEPPIGGPGYNRLLKGGRLPVPTRDGFIAMLPYTADHWAALFRAAGREDLIAHFQVHDRDARNANLVEMYREMTAATRLRTSAEWLQSCRELDIPATRIYALDELPDHPHLAAVGLFRTVEHPTEGTIRIVAPPTRFARTPASVRSLAPRLGEHTADVLGALGYGAQELEALAAQGVIGIAPG